MGTITREEEDHHIAYATKQCSKCGYQYDADNCPSCNEEPVEDVKVTQRMAVTALGDYAAAHKKEKEAKSVKEALSKAIIKPYLKDNPRETLYDGESELEARLEPHSAPRWLDYEGIEVHLLMYAVQNDLLKLNLTQVDKLVKRGDDSAGFVRFTNRIRPGGEGEPRLKVSKRDERS